MAAYGKNVHALIAACKLFDLGRFSVTSAMIDIAKCEGKECEARSMVRFKAWLKQLFMEVCRMRRLLKVVSQTRQFWRELVAWDKESNALTARREITDLARQYGGTVTWDRPEPVAPPLPVQHECAGDWVVYRAERMTREDAERRQYWDHLMALRQEARDLRDKLARDDYSRMRQLLEE